MEVRGGRYTGFSNYFQYLYLINGIISASNLTSISKYLVYLVVQIKKNHTHCLLLRSDDMRSLISIQRLLSCDNIGCTVSPEFSVSLRITHLMSVVF